MSEHATWYVPVPTLVWMSAMCHVTQIRKAHGTCYSTHRGTVLCPVWCDRRRAGLIPPAAGHRDRRVRSRNLPACARSPTPSVALSSAGDPSRLPTCRRLGVETYFCFCSFMFYVASGVSLKGTGERCLPSEDGPLTPNMDGVMALGMFRKRARNTTHRRTWDLSMLVFLLFFAPRPPGTNPFTPSHPRTTAVSA